MCLRRPAAALTVSLVLITAAPAVAQTSGAALVGPIDQRLPPVFSRSHAPDFRMPEGDLRRVGAPQRNGLIAAVPVNSNLQIGIGRFRIGEIARPLNNTETDRQGTAVRPRDRAMAGIGFSLRFRR